ncbi:MAG: citrate (Si)-synthase, partial [Proteobacteria bacterium]|nr:citrate (Si)-synthase [Pseudomonadota bacterium]
MPDKTKQDSPAGSLKITDTRTGKNYEIPIENESVRAMDLRQIKVKDDDFGLLAYDPAFMNTASCKSNITFIDGEKGILLYRGYPIEQLAEKCSYLEVAYLILFGEIPTKSQLEDWTEHIRFHTYVHENVKQVMEGFRYDAHPMGIFVSTLAALSTFYPESRKVLDPDVRQKQIWRLIG